ETGREKPKTQPKQTTHTTNNQQHSAAGSMNWLIKKSKNYQTPQPHTQKHAQSQHQRCIPHPTRKNQNTTKSNQPMQPTRTPRRHQRFTPQQPAHTTHKKACSQSHKPIQTKQLAHYRVLTQHTHTHRTTQAIRSSSLDDPTHSHEAESNSPHNEVLSESLANTRFPTATL
ncbi:hypothetical protein, partial [Corynebacterium aquatimens]|uniref:hypothetical protein n=1 Tax=Corynebacterium aquatimens TaxID=1190508 RepID=UPI00361262B4